MGAIKYGNSRGEGDVKDISEVYAYLEDPTVICARCRATLPSGDALYDMRTEFSFCDDDCFREWADDNYEYVVEYYCERNIE